MAQRIALPLATMPATFRLDFDTIRKQDGGRYAVRGTLELGAIEGGVQLVGGTEIPVPCEVIFEQIAHGWQVAEVTINPVGE